ncbi:helix-turn-helix transcriptional regulator (plasmid) [Nostoc sp. UHCC 0926]|uniref:helix-turn-helix transcriptional regulator n=1 Tax=Nostoc sp. UHCC 0926 TaxID=3025190 RepID=UPI0023600014|nr:helix-turn-helix transcriptional regulator [Nostoc sp. UHCC 0926]WDD30121.1 helix-turn-helix transcriptional regulator [Nostoc sp. UHCC 0926]
MDESKRQRLEASGWRVGTAEEFLGLSPAESELIEMKLALGQKLKVFRTSQDLSQQALAKRMESSQSRIAKMESGDPSVSVDLLVRALLFTGATREDVAEAIISENKSKSSRELVNA